MDDIKITVRDFGFFYGTSKVLENIDMDIPRNAITAIIGPRMRQIHSSSHI